MTDQTPNPAQSGIMDELEAELVQFVDDVALAKKPDGELVEITPEGEVRDPTEKPAPTETIDSDAEEIPLPEGLDENVTFEDIEAAKPTPAELLVDPNDPGDVFRKMDRADEDLILAELQNRALETFLYSFESGGKLLTDLTVAGVNETVRLMNERGGAQVGISDQPPVVEYERRGEEEYVRVMVFARDSRMPGSGRWGTAMEPVKQQGGSKKGEWDKFAFTKALNKAQRNALKMQIPEDWRQYIIAQYLNTTHVKNLEPLNVVKGIGAGAVAELPPALDDDEAKAIKAEIHEAFNRLRKLNPIRCPPAKLQGFLTKAETESHERMRLLLKSLEQWIEEEEDAVAKRAANQQGAAQ